MNPVVEFLEPPRIEWHAKRPFAIARLPVDYARAMTRLALEHEERVQQLPVTAGWKKQAADNPTGSRYGYYNAMLLGPQCLPLFLALRSTYRFLLQTVGQPNQPACLQSWFNVHRAGQNLLRHSHKAAFIGAFAACAEGSETVFGPFPKPTPHDHAFANRDGQLLVTTGPNHFHEVSVWIREDSPRVSFAFDIVTAESWRPDRVLIPFDGDGFEI